MQQVPGMYSIPYYPMVPPNMMYPSMMIPVNNSSEVAQEPNASMTSVVTPVQPYMMPYIPVQPSSDRGNYNQSLMCRRWIPYPTRGGVSLPGREQYPYDHDASRIYGTLSAFPRGNRFWEYSYSTS